MSALRWMTAGESHGSSMTVIIDGVPAGLALRAQSIDADLARRQKGYGRGGRQKIEHDVVRIDSGVRGGETLGSPIALWVSNRDHANWQGIMGAAPFDTPPAKVTVPRPGHIDLSGARKYRRADIRDVLERGSARETVSRVAAGAVARALLSELGVRVLSRVVSIAGVVSEEITPSVEQIVQSYERIEESSLRMFDGVQEHRAREKILELSHQGDTAGGVFEVVATGVPYGLGSHVQWDRRIDGRIAQALMSIPAVKACELGDGWSGASQPGSSVHDPIGWDTVNARYTRSSNHAGGVEGGVTTGEPLIVRAAMKPLPTLREPLASVDMHTHTPTVAFRERSDVCAVPAAAVIAEAMICLVLADCILETLGGDAMGDILTRHEAHMRG